MEDESRLAIAEMAATAGITTDALRWYEREGVLPRVPRDASGHRRYGPAEQGLVALLLALRGAGMSVAGARSFVELLGEGAASHGRRISLLEEGRDLLREQRRRLDAAEAALERKIAHYELLIAAGLDCTGAPVPDDQRARQSARA
ncbi:DNA-binding transcriptional MerR regulator [Salana multivorans]|uniref:DNA-binding transcriptional MerR regulator n=1 Tax=Salana multivorans TaxID=120377 RepID=A0A3N2DD19_9MICO|nr:MerR family transcriptional regulator [Salana multivorans]ROR97695.1 DNA-binding transcriptional MerR regulator [Salana multivorans]